MTIPHEMIRISHDMQWNSDPRPYTLSRYYLAPERRRMVTDSPDFDLAMPRREPSKVGRWWKRLLAF